jgi:SAM-dependent methyltransferase
VYNATLANVSRYYDSLHLWTRWNAGFRSFSGLQHRTIHRWLVHPLTGAFDPTTVHDLILSTGIGQAEVPDALDAGCGYGGTMFALHAALGGRWHGITISRRQYEFGRAAARKRGAARDVTFALRSYDEALSRRYNLAYAIESLVHSPDPRRTIGNIAGSLSGGGTFIIVDDMPADRLPPDARKDLDTFKAMWRCPVMPTAEQVSLHLEDAGCEFVLDRDLTPLMRPREHAAIAKAMEEVGARRRWRDRLGLRRIGEAEIGGLLLEKLCREGVVRYRMICARKRG